MQPAARRDTGRTMVALAAAVRLFLYWTVRKAPPPQRVACSARSAQAAILAFCSSTTFQLHNGANFQQVTLSATGIYWGLQRRTWLDHAEAHARMSNCN